MWWLPVSVFFFCFGAAATNDHQSFLNIALHAQVAPDVGGSIVGSVLTTDGLKAAFDLRFETAHVRIFYPYNYSGIFTTRWDVVIIEGWFMMIHEFIQLVRSHSPEVKIIFFCLDPTFPGIAELIQFDVDGYMTNSEFLASYLGSHTRIPTEYVMLAADQRTMQLNITVRKDWGAVYVGAGGVMLESKPKLLSMLEGAVPFGLRLHGAGWGTVEQMKDIWLGPLSRYGLAEAYSSAHVVLASTIESQRKMGMINNRVFEALACGAIVISDNFTALHSLAGSVLLFASTAGEVERHIKYVMDNPLWAKGRSEAGRSLVLHGHTWSHRVIQILDFYYSLKSSGGKAQHSATSLSNEVRNDQENADERERESKERREVSCGAVSCNRTNCPKLLWVISRHLNGHSDVTFVIDEIGLGVLCRHYAVTYVISSDDRWRRLEVAAGLTEPTTMGSSQCASPSESCSKNTTRENDPNDWLRQFDVLLAVATPFDRLDRTLRLLPTGFPLNRTVDRPQRRAAYFLGFDSQLMSHYVSLKGEAAAMGSNHSSSSPSSSPSSPPSIAFPHYDVIWYRSSYELSLLIIAGFQADYFRTIHCFGVGDLNHISGADSKESESQINSTRTSFQSWSDLLILPSNRSSRGLNGTYDCTGHVQSDNCNAGRGTEDLHDPNQSDVKLISRDEVTGDDNLAVCFIAHLSSCLFEIRESWIPASSKPYRLLLLGGTLSQWMDSDAAPGGKQRRRGKERVGGKERRRSRSHHGGSVQGPEGSSSGKRDGDEEMDGEEVCEEKERDEDEGEEEGEGQILDLVRTVLVGTHRTARAVDMIRRSKNVFIFHGGDAVATEDSGGAMGSAVSTVDDIIWPIVAAVQSGSRIFLSQPNTHLQSLNFGSHIPSDTWTALGARRTMSSGIVRLHGFGVRTARVDVTRVTSNEEGMIIPYDCCPPPLPSSAECHPHYPSHSSFTPLPVKGQSQIPSAGPGSTPSLAPLFLQVTFTDFLVGRDGSCCVVHKGVTLICLIRPVKLLVINFTAPPAHSTSSSSLSSSSSSPPSTSSSSSSAAAAAAAARTVNASISDTLPAVSHSHSFNMEVSLSLSLRGNMFADEIFHLPLLLPLCLDASRDHAGHPNHRNAMPSPSNIFEITVQL